MPASKTKAPARARSATTPANEVATAGRAKPSSAQFVMQEVDELPAKHVAGRQSPLVGNLETLRIAALADPKKIGRWVEVAHYNGRWGAQNVIRDIKSGDRAAPEGIWEMESRISENAEPGKGPSILYARYIGENETAEVQA